MNRIRRYNESHIESFSKQEREIIIEIFNDFVEEYDILHYDPDNIVEDVSTYFIIESSFSYEERSYTSINIYFQIYNDKGYNRIVEGLKVLSSGIKEYMNQDCCMIRVDLSSLVVMDRTPFNIRDKKRIEFFITDAEAIKWIRQGHFNKWNTLKEI